mmetsp:Transcript_2271/g.5244  ORF Transcript_2271/g.5244 Transcript_2271/m.5244 type:complete len:162 (-) Transcript_2271:84-569(-)
MDEGRHEEGLALLRNAVAAASLSEGGEGETATHESNALQRLVDALRMTNAIDELEQIVPKYREAARAQSRNSGRVFGPMELKGMYLSAQLHEARERPHESEREVRALLHLLRENPKTVHDFSGECQTIMERASQGLFVLTSESGNADLIQAWAGELAKLRR